MAYSLIVFQNEVILYVVWIFGVWGICRWGAARDVGSIQIVRGTCNHVWPEWQTGKLEQCYTQLKR